MSSNYKSNSLDWTINELGRKELVEIRSKYNFPVFIYKRISSYYRLFPTRVGTIVKTINFLDELFKDYGFDTPILEGYIRRYADIMTASPVELERKLVILNFVGLAEKVIAESPQELVDRAPLTALKMYAVIQDLLDKGEEASFDNLYQKDLYTNDELNKLKKIYPLKVSEYDKLQERYAKSRELKRERQHLIAEQNGNVVKLILKK